MHDTLTKSAKIGIGLGVVVGVLFIIAILLWIFIDPLGRIQHRRNADRVEAAIRAQGCGRSPPGSPTPPRLREIAFGSSSMCSPGAYEERPQEMTPLQSPLAVRF